MKWIQIRHYSLMVLLIVVALAIPLGAGAQNFDASPPAEPVKLIFIHHSTGENWLADGYGNLGITLAENNYFVSDTNYGWGPDGIGDRTDIPNWPEWFVGPDSGRYLQALFAENEQHSDYGRLFSDPGGENQIVMFKSCFPNSMLEGNPDDPPRREGDWMSVGNAKAIYNELLGFFATRPDKLFVVITAPPVQDPTFAENARAFNLWLVNDWLESYEGSNVAVFDFYNVLTGPDSHHYFQETYIAHAWGTSNILHYPSGDDHPSAAGSQKATDEFVPLLNVYYHLWQDGEPPAPPPPAQDAPDSPPPPAEDQPPPLVAQPPAVIGGVIDNFESGEHAWEIFHDGHSVLECQRDGSNAYSGAAGMRINYNIEPEGWASCNLVYPQVQDWSGEDGLVFYVRSESVGQAVIVVAHQGSSSDDMQPFELQLATDQTAVDGWQRVDVRWDQLKPPPWSDNPSADFVPNQAMGIGFIFGEEVGSGHLWVDDISFLSAAPPQPELYQEIESEEEPAAPEPAPDSSEEKEAQDVEQAADVESEDEGGGVCPGSLAVSVLAMVGVFWSRRKTV